MKNEIQNYIQKQNPKERRLLEKARELVLKTIPGSDESLKWGVLSYSGGKIYLAVIKDKVHVGFSIVGLSEKEIENFEGSGKTARHIKIFSEKDLKEKNIAKLIKMVNKKAGIPE